MSINIEKHIQIEIDRFVSNLSRLICIESVSGEPKVGAPFGQGPAAALREALEIARSFGFDTKNLGYVGTVDFGPRERQLDILVHLDVVPAGDGWSVTKPFEPKVVNDKIFGRGAADNKGPAMAALYAMKAVKDLCIPLKRGVRLILGTDEENGSRDISWYYAHEKAAPMTISPDADFPVINIEKGGFQPKFWARFEDTAEFPCVKSLHSGLKGNMIPGTAEAALIGFNMEDILSAAGLCAETTGVKFDCTSDGIMTTVVATGVSAHASMPWNGNNALTAMLEFISHLPNGKGRGFELLRALHETFPHGDWKGEAAGVSMSDLDSGELTICLDVLNYADGYLSGAFDSRLPLCATEKNVRDVLLERFKKIGIEVENRSQFPPHFVDANSPLVLGLMKCYRQYTNRDDKPLAIGGSTYVHEVDNGVAFGCSMPGTDNHMHGADEFAVISELILSTKIFAQVIVDFCS